MSQVSGQFGLVSYSETLDKSSSKHISEVQNASSRQSFVSVINMQQEQLGDVQMFKQVLFQLHVKKTVIKKLQTPFECKLRQLKESHECIKRNQL